MKKLQLYSVWYVDNDGADKEACYRGYKAAANAAKAFSIIYGEAIVEGMLFSDSYSCGSFAGRNWAA